MTSSKDAQEPPVHRRFGARPDDGAARAGTPWRSRLRHQGRRSRRADRQPRPFAFEILVQSRTQERLSRIYADSLRRIGIYAIVRLADEMQYERRRQKKFDFDMLIAAWIASPSPGYEQRFLWGSQSADQEASYNLAGARSPAIDAMIAAMIAAKTHEEFDDAVRAYDRVLLSGFYIVPLFYAREQWIAYSNKLASEVHSVVRGDNRQLVAEAAVGGVDTYRIHKTMAARVTTAQ